jgi:predicted aspartyl protease
MDTLGSLAGLSRRRLIGHGAAMLALASAARGQSAPGTGLAEPLPAEIKVSAHHLTLDVRINGQGPFRFVVDTGADRSLLAVDVAAALGLPVGRQVLVEGIIRSVMAETVPVRELSFGSVTCSDLTMPVLPRSLLQADGYLGLDTIGGHRVVFDFKNQKMEIGEPTPPTFITRLATNQTRIPAPGPKGHLRSADCRVDGVPTVAFIDTGAEVTTGNTPLLEALVRANPAYRTTRPITLSGITGGSSTGQVVKVENIKLVNLEFSGCELAVADLQVFKIWELEEKPAILIGLNFLTQFARVSVDYGRKEIRLDLASATPWISWRA